VRRRQFLTSSAAALAGVGLAGLTGCDPADRPEELVGPYRIERSYRRWDGIAYPVWEPDAYGGPEVANGLSDIADLGAPSVTIIPTWYQADTAASAVGRDPEQTPTDESVRAAIRTARALGLEVMLKPHVDLPGDQDRADIAPTDPDAWFAAYTDMVVGYAELAEREDVGLFCVGTELAGTVADPRWRAVVAAVRSAYRGELTYAANFDSYRAVPFWGDLDVIGIDAYFELATTPTDDVTALVAAWRPFVDDMTTFAAEAGADLMFTEAGYVSQVGTTTQPWNWLLGPGGDRPAERSDREQAAAYVALTQVAAEMPSLRGVQWWMWDDLADSGEPQGTDYTPHGKGAERVLRIAWRDR